MYVAARWNMLICTKNMLHATIDFKKTNSITSHALAAICVALNTFKITKANEVATKSDEEDFAACCNEYTNLTGFALSTSTSMRQAVGLNWGPAAVQVYEYLLALGYNSTSSDFWGHFLNAVRSVNVSTKADNLDFNL